MDNKIPDYVTWKVLKSGIVLLNLNSGNYYTLNETASEIWDNIAAKKKWEEIISAIRERYDCSKEQAETDVKKTFTFLVNEGLLEEVKINKGEKEVLGERER